MLVDIENLYQESESAFFVLSRKTEPGEGRDWEKVELFKENAGLKTFWAACSWKKKKAELSVRWWLVNSFQCLYDVVPAMI